MNDGTNLEALTPENASKTQDELNVSVDAELRNMGYPVDTTEPEKVEPPKDDAPSDDPVTPPASDDAAETDEPANPVTPPAPVEPPKQDPPAPVAPVEVPELTLEIEDAQGNKVVLKPGDSLDQVLAEFEPKNNGQIFQIIHDFGKLESKHEAATAEARTKAQADAEAAREQERQQETLSRWDAEAQGLRELGDLSVPKAKPGTAEYDKDPAVVREVAVYNYMAKQNAERVQEGKPPIVSFTQAFYAMQKEEQAAKAKEELTQDNADAKAKAALVGRGGSPANNAPEPYVAGSAKSIWDVR